MAKSRLSKDDLNQIQNRIKPVMPSEINLPPMQETLTDRFGLQYTPSPPSPTTTTTPTGIQSLTIPDSAVTQQRTTGQPQARGLYDIPNQNESYIYDPSNEPSEFQKNLIRLQYGYGEGAGLGASQNVVNNQSPEFQRFYENEIANSGAFKVGQGLGYVTGGAAVGNVVESGLRKPLSKLGALVGGRFGSGAARQVASTATRFGAAEGLAETGLSAVESINRGETLPQALNRAAIQVPLGTVAGAALGAGTEAIRAGRVANQLRNQRATANRAYQGFTDVFDELPAQQTVPLQQGDNVIDAPVNVRNIEADEALPTSPLQNVEGEVSPLQQADTSINFDSIKVADDLPSTEEGLTQYIQEAISRQQQGFQINLQLFAEAQDKLKTFKSIYPEGYDTRNLIVDGQDNSKPTIRERWQSFYRDWVDTEDAASDFSRMAEDDTYQRAINYKKVSGTVDAIANNNLVDFNGNDIGRPLKSIVGEIPKGKETDFWDYMLHKHNIDRYNEGKPVFFNYDDSQSLQRVKAYEDANPEFKKLSSDLNTFMKKFKKAWLEDTGLISKELAEDLDKAYKNYIPTQREFSQLEKGAYGYGAGSGYVDTPSAIKTATGSDRNITNPLENILNLVNRTVRLAKRNEIGKGIYKAIQKQPEKLKRFAELLPDNYNFSGNANLNNVVTVVDGGKTKYIKINNKEFLDFITGASSQKLPKGKYVKMANDIFKGLITQKNPLFAIKNIVRDFPQAYVYGSEKNPVRFTRDYFSAIRDLATDSEIARQYRGVGGMSQGFFSTDASTRYANILRGQETVGDIIKKYSIDNIERLNNLTENAPRLAEFKRVLERTGNIEESLYASGEVTTNFARGGKAAKYWDTYVPYLNASIQGADRLARQIAKNPVQTAIKGVAVITVPTIAQEVINNIIDPEGYSSLSNRTKDSYFVVATGDGKFIKIPKSRELGMLFSSLFQRLYRKATGDDEAFKGFYKNLATSIGPTNPVQSNLAAPLLINLRANKDFADRAIVPDYMKDRSPYLQYDETTTSISKAIARAAKEVNVNLSPKQLDYIIDAYTGIVGDIIIPATSDTRSVKNALLSQFTSDVAYSSQSTNDFYEKRAELEQLDDDNSFMNVKNTEAKNINTIKNTVNRISGDLSELFTFIKETDNENLKRDVRLKIAELTEKANTLIDDRDNQGLKAIETEIFKYKQTLDGIRR